MFCSKCGTKAIDGAAFCQKCGAKLIDDTPVGQPASAPSSNPAQPPSPTQAKPRGKNKPKMAIVIGTVIAVVILLLVLFTLGNRNKTNDGNKPNSNTLTTSISSNKIAPDDVIFYEDIYVSQFYGASVEQLVEKFGPPVDEYEDGSAAFDDFDYALDNNGSISAIRAYNPKKFTVNGNTLNLGTLDIVELLGSDYDAINDPDLGYCMRYYYSAYTIIFEIGDVDGVASNIWITNDKPLDTDDISTTNTLLYRGIPVDSLLGTTYENMIQILGEPDSTLFEGEENTYGDATIYFDLWNWDRPYLRSITSNSLSDFTYSGHALSGSSVDMSQIFGREPDDARVFYDTYSMTYEWDHMGAKATLTINTPATEDSTAATNVSVSWWPEDENDVPANNLPTLPDGFEWIEEPSWTTKSFGPYYSQEMITGVIKNTSGESKSYVQIMFNLYDSTGYQIGQAMGNITNFSNGSSWRFEAWPAGVSGTIASFEFAELTGW